MAHTWTVVKFIEENSVEAIPTTWLLGRDHCYWPPFIQERIQNVIKRHEEPNTCWPLHKIEVFKSGTYGNFLIHFIKTVLLNCQGQFFYANEMYFLNKHFQIEAPD